MIISRFNHAKFNKDLLEEQNRGDIIKLLARQKDPSTVTNKKVGNLYEKFAGDYVSGMNKNKKKEYFRMCTLVTV